MKYAEFVLGNSSSGIIETPAFHVPTVNIGNRPRGRLQSASIIHCDPETRSIINAINKALSDEYKALCKEIISPYGYGNAGQQIAKQISKTIEKDVIDLKKHFYDLK